jgi:hypothetical protein
MDTPSYSRRSAFDNPAIYSITVQGWIGEDQADRLAGMKITVIIPEGERPVTTLLGELRDQAALAGVLDTLYGWHLPVLSLQRLSGGSSAERSH